MTCSIQTCFLLFSPLIYFNILLLLLLLLFNCTAILLATNMLLNEFFLTC